MFPWGLNRVSQESGCLALGSQCTTAKTHSLSDKTVHVSFRIFLLCVCDIWGPPKPGPLISAFVGNMCNRVSLEAIKVFSQLSLGPLQLCYLQT